MLLSERRLLVCGGRISAASPPRIARDATSRRRSGRPRCSAARLGAALDGAAHATRSRSAAKVRCSTVCRSSTSAVRGRPARRPRSGGRGRGSRKDSLHRKILAQEQAAARAFDVARLPDRGGEVASRGGEDPALADLGPDDEIEAASVAARGDRHRAEQPAALRDADVERVARVRPDERRRVLQGAQGLVDDDRLRRLGGDAYERGPGRPSAPAARRR